MEKQREEEQLKERRASQAIESGKEVMIEVENLQMEPAAPSTSRNNVVQRVLSSVLSSIHSGVQSIMEPVQVEEEELKVKSPLHPLVPLGAPSPAQPESQSHVQHWLSSGIAPSCFHLLNIHHICS